MAASNGARNGTKVPEIIYFPSEQENVHLGHGAQLEHAPKTQHDWAIAWPCLRPVVRTGRLNAVGRQPGAAAKTGEARGASDSD